MLLKDRPLCCTNLMKIDQIMNIYCLLYHMAFLEMRELKLLHLADFIGCKNLTISMCPLLTGSVT